MTAPPPATDPCPSDLMAAAVAATVPALPLVRLLGTTLAAVPPIEKPDGSPVTAADYAVQAVVVSRLRALLPHGRVPLLGEEHADALVASRRPDAERLVVDAVRSVLGWRSRAEAIRAIEGDEPRAGEPHWTLDPIDGTKGFVAGEQCSVCLAMVSGADVAVAVLGCPRMAGAGDAGLHPGGPGVIYAAASGAGAYEVSADGGARSRIALPAWSGGAVRWARSMNRSASPAPSRLEPLLEAVGPLREVRMDSQCKYALVARGDADLAVRLPRGAGHRESAWDHASGVLLVSEAGGAVSDARGARLDFSHGASLSANSGVLCAARGLDRAVAPIVAGLAEGSSR